MNQSEFKTYLRKSNQLIYNPVIQSQSQLLNRSSLKNTKLISCKDFLKKTNNNIEESLEPFVQKMTMEYKKSGKLSNTHKKYLNMLGINR
jgi:hypothetical protein